MTNIMIFDLLRERPVTTSDHCVPIGPTGQRDIPNADITPTHEPRPDGDTGIHPWKSTKIFLFFLLLAIPFSTFSQPINSFSMEYGKTALEGTYDGHSQIGFFHYQYRYGKLGWKAGTGLIGYGQRDFLSLEAVGMYRLYQDMIWGYAGANTSEKLLDIAPLAGIQFNFLTSHNFQLHCFVKDVYRNGHETHFGLGASVILSNPP